MKLKTYKSLEPLGYRQRRQNHIASSPLFIEKMRQNHSYKTLTISRANISCFSELMFYNYLHASFPPQPFRGVKVYIPQTGNSTFC